MSSVSCVCQGDEWEYGRIEGQSSRQTDGQTEGGMDGLTDKGVHVFVKCVPGCVKCVQVCVV